MQSGVQQLEPLSHMPALEVVFLFRTCAKDLIPLKDLSPLASLPRREDLSVARRQCAM